MKNVNHILEHWKEVLAFLKGRFPLYHQSNVFFRDLQFGIQAMLQRKGLTAGYTESERIAREFARLLEEENILIPIDQQSWVMNYPEFKTPVRKAAAPAKPAAPAPGRSPAPAGAKAVPQAPSDAASSPGSTPPASASTGREAVSPPKDGGA